MHFRSISAIAWYLGCGESTSHDAHVRITRNADSILCIFAAIASQVGQVVGWTRGGGGPVGRGVCRTIADWSGAGWGFLAVIGRSPLFGSIGYLLGFFDQSC